MPSTIHSYLSSQFKELRSLSKDDARLKEKGLHRWYVPDPRRNIDLDEVRKRRLLSEFWSYLPPGYLPAALDNSRRDLLPGIVPSIGTNKKAKKISELRAEAVRVGFGYCYQKRIIRQFYSRLVCCRNRFFKKMSTYKWYTMLR